VGTTSLARDWLEVCHWGLNSPRGRYTGGLKARRRSRAGVIWESSDNMNKDILVQKFQQALSYEDFVASGAAEGHDKTWNQRYEQLTLEPEQQEMISGWVREMNVLCLTGTWCGDCSLQGAAMARIAEANPKINLRFIPRSEEHGDLITISTINAGHRVPVSWFMAEDFEMVSWFGDRTLSRYRSMAEKQLGPGQSGCNSPRPNDPVREVLNEVLNEFERVQLLLRLSGRFREKYGD